jgi:hypothetical protein
VIGCATLPVRPQEIARHCIVTPVPARASSRDQPPHTTASVCICMGDALPDDPLLLSDKEAGVETTLSLSITTLSKLTHSALKLQSTVERWFREDVVPLYHPYLSGKRGLLLSGTYICVGTFSKNSAIDE